MKKHHLLVRNIKSKKFSGESERAKNGGVLGEEIFCPRADGFSCPPRQLAGRAIPSV